MKCLLLLFLTTVTVVTKAQGVRLQYFGDKQRIISAVAEANRILGDTNFYNRIDTIRRFDNSTYTGMQISSEMRNLNQTIFVDEYWNPFSRANAGSVSGININTAKLRRSIASITNTIIHESVHVVDWLSNQTWNYTHETNSPSEQENTAPWVIGAIGESMAR